MLTILKMEKQNFYDLSLQDLTEVLVKKGEKAFRAQQLFHWVYAKGEVRASEMTNISKDLREKLYDNFSFDLPQIIKHQISKDGTQKFLFDVGKGLSVESVLIPSGDRMTLCLSSEVGCNIACKFCYTAKQKLKKRLSAGEIVGQFIQVNQQTSQRITNIVYMGMGEPLDNPKGVFDSIKIFHDKLGLNISLKKITLSTSGVLSEFHRIEQSGVRLAVSLNGVNDEVRTKIMPINKKWPLKELLSACANYTEKTKEKMTFEYVLLKGITDSLDDARDLYKITKNIPCKINIIPFNEYPQSDFKRPSSKTIEEFQNTLLSLGAHVLKRRTMGRDISAACGQLATLPPSTLSE